MPWEIPRFCECRYPEHLSLSWCFHCHRPLHQSGRSRRPAITFVTRRVKKLAELTAADIPRGVDPYDLATDYDSSDEE